MTPPTEVIDMRTPATAPIPVVVPEPTWDAIVRPRRHPRRVRGRDLGWVGLALQLGAYLVLVTWLAHLAGVGLLVAQSLPWAPK